MPIYDYKLLLDADHKAGANGNTYSQNEINFGIVTPGVADSNKFGVHIVVTQTYTDLNSGMDFRVVTGASASSTTKVVERRILKAVLTAGKHYYIPVPPGTILQYARLKHVPVSENGTLGKIQSWFGPDMDGSV